MRSLAIALAVLGAVMVAVLGWRLMGGGVGPRTWIFAALTAGVLIAAVLTWRRGPRASGPTV